MKIGFVVQRYGRGVLGGAETQARRIATRLVGVGADVTVLTTNSKDHLKWDSFFPAGICVEDGVQVKRFPVAEPRRTLLFRLYHHVFRIFLRLRPSGWCGSLWRRLDSLWFRLQGPHVPGLYEALDEYDVLFFFTYLYAPTLYGLPRVRHKAVLIPEAHDEDPFYFPSVEKLFHAARHVFFNTTAEKSLAQKQGYLEGNHSWVVGCGVDNPRVMAQLSQDPFLLYMGRFDEKKGVKQLLYEYAIYRQSVEKPYRLVLIGDDADVGQHDGVETLGFVSSEERERLLSSAAALVSFSQQESLSLVVLEAFAVGIPVILGNTCDVFRDYAQNVPIARLVREDGDFINAVLDLKQVSQCDVQDSKVWLAQRYGWDRVLELYLAVAKSLS